MRNTVFIFGAGASHDCLDPELVPSHNLMWRPPLADQILGDCFDEVVKRHQGAFTSLSDLLPDARRIIRNLKKNEQTKTFEDLLTEIMTLHKERNISHRLVQILDMRFYLRWLFRYCSEEYFDKGSNYSDLLHKLMNRVDDGVEITFATFNYDILIEKALRDVGIATDRSSIHKFIEWQIPLIKLHGSIEWVYEIYLQPRALNKNEISRYFSQGNKYDLIVEKIRRKQIELNHGELKLSNPTQIPAIAIPLTDKREFECPKNHEQLLEARLKSASNIVIIGWKAGDRHLLNVMKECCAETHPHLIVVSKTIEGAQGVVDTIRTESFAPRSSRPIAGGFSAFMDSHNADRLDALLSQSHAMGPHIEAKPYR